MIIFKVNNGMHIYLCINRYDQENCNISYSCYSGIVRCGDKAASEIIKAADPVLSSYLKDAGNMKLYPEIEAISPKVNKISPAVSGGLILITFAFAVIIYVYFHLSETSSRRSTRLGMCVDSAKSTTVTVGNKKTKRIPSASVRTRKEKSDDEEDSSASVNEGNIFSPF